MNLLRRALSDLVILFYKSGAVLEFQNQLSSSQALKFPYYIWDPSEPTRALETQQRK